MGETNRHQQNGAQVGDRDPHCPADASDRLHDLGRHSAVLVAEVLWARIGVRKRSGAELQRPLGQLPAGHRRLVPAWWDRRQPAWPWLVRKLEALRRWMVVRLPAQAPCGARCWLPPAETD